jgi:hypothetical protein
VLAARFWTIYFLTASNRGSVAFEKRREIRQGGLDAVVLGRSSFNSAIGLLIP